MFCQFTLIVATVQVEAQYGNHGFMEMFRSRVLEFEHFPEAVVSQQDLHKPTLPIMDCRKKDETKPSSSNVTPSLQTSEALTIRVPAAESDATNCYGVLPSTPSNVTPKAPVIAHSPRLTPMLKLADTSLFVSASPVYTSPAESFETAASFRATSPFALDVITPSAFDTHLQLLPSTLPSEELRPGQLTPMTSFAPSSSLATQVDAGLDSPLLDVFSADDSSEWAAAADTNDPLMSLHIASPTVKSQ